MARVLPMFPLGNVLVPTAMLPLHVFEDRYRAMIADVLADDGEFGVVLIERGVEVGGGEVRSDLGTVARVLRAEELDDGRWVVVCVGARRIRVVRWLEDDPYPRAEVEDAPELTDGDGSAARGAAVAALRRVLALASELGLDAASATTPIAEDAPTASYNVLALSPLGPLDRHRLLGIDDAVERLRRTEEELAEVEGDLLARLRLDEADGSP